MLKVKSSVVDY